MSGAPLLRLEEPAQPAAGGWALWALGFRPFYLLAGAFAALSVALWALQSTGHLPQPYLPGPLWHAHEMLFGFALPVIVGFLFTAGRTWTQQPTPTGWPLAGLALLWLAGRLLAPGEHVWASACVNAGFPLAAAAALAVPFLRAGSRRNYFFVGLLALFAAATLLVHLDRLGIAPDKGWLGIRLALDVVLFMLCVMGGRVIPMFTNNGVPGARARRQPWVERAALGSVLALLVADLVQAGAPVLAAVAAFAAATHALRWFLWQPWRTGRKPLVWVLHLAYVWVPLHLALRSAAALGVVAPTLATHALTVGAIGGMVMGMMTRTSRGHTARPLRADAFDTAAYALLAAAAPVRVLLPLVAPGWTLWAWLGSALLWSAAFALFTVRYLPVLTRARLDGKAG